MVIELCISFLKRVPRSLMPVLMLFLSVCLGNFFEKCAENILINIRIIGYRDGLVPDRVIGTYIFIHQYPAFSTFPRESDFVCPYR
jgi:hypothetical protein